MTDERDIAPDSTAARVAWWRALHVQSDALAHTVANKVEAAYRRTDLLEQRRSLMEAWAKHVCPQDQQRRI